MDLKALWQAALGELEINLSKASFTTWFKDTFISSFEDRVLTIAVPHSFAKEWLEKKYNKQIFQTLSKLSKEKIKEIRYKIVTRPKESLLPSLEPKKEVKEIGLNPYYTFETFVVGPNNRLAQAAAYSVAKTPGKSYNPLFIYGGVGLGKTHLMQAIGNEINQKHPEKKVLYATCEKFANEFIRSVQSGRMNQFKDKYRNIDALLIDDIQFLAGKEGTKEEFFHTYNSLYEEGRQIVISSDRPPKALSALEDRLISRFGGGMIADISPPNLETRIAILKQKRKEKNYQIDDEILELIAQRIQQNIRELEGALNRLIATCQFQDQKPSLELANQILATLAPSIKRGLSLDRILEIVAEFYNLKKELLFDKKRDKEIVYPRQIAMYLIRHELNFSFPKIAKELKRDHTTVIHGCEKIEKEIIYNEGLREEINLIKERLFQE